MVTARQMAMFCGTGIHELVKVGRVGVRDAVVGCSGRVAVVAWRDRFEAGELLCVDEIAEPLKKGHADLYEMHMERIDGTERELGPEVVELLGKRTECPKCDGIKTVVSDCPHCRQEWERKCQKCLGLGDVFGEGHAKLCAIENVVYLLSEIWRVYRLPGFRCRVLDPDGMGLLVFSFNDGFGVVARAKDIEAES